MELTLGPAGAIAFGARCRRITFSQNRHPAMMLATLALSHYLSPIAPGRQRGAGAFCLHGAPCYPQDWPPPQRCIN